MPDIGRRAHAYDPDPRSSLRTPPCMCGQTIAYRAHQPLWWRLLNWRVMWR